MPKKKNYQISLASPVIGVNEENDFSSKSGLQEPTGIRRADIDMVNLLGADARFTSSARKIHFSSHLNRGIDEWIYATADAIRSLLLGGQATITAGAQRSSMMLFFDFLTDQSKALHIKNHRPVSPADLAPQHIEQFIAWRKSHGLMMNEKPSSTRTSFQNVKAVLIEMLKLGYISGESHQFFRRGVFSRDRDSDSDITSFSDAEQERIAVALKADLSAIHHGRLEVSNRELQALRFLLVAHRLGHNTTPLLELRRDAMKPGVLPGTIILETSKGRNLRVDNQIGRDGGNSLDRRPEASGESEIENQKPVETKYLPFNLAEGAVIGQAISSTEHLTTRAPNRIKNRVWLYESNQLKSAKQSTGVTALTPLTVFISMNTFVARHNIMGDDGNPMVINTSRLRKSKFDRAFRISEGDLTVTPNLMGNTPHVAGINYPSMNIARQLEANGYMNEDYIDAMRGKEVKKIKFSKSNNVEGVKIPAQISLASSSKVLTPMGACGDSVGGEHAPNNGSHCDRFVMCLFCSSFAIVGSVDELWKLFSFQVFAQSELEYLEDFLENSPSGDTGLGALQDLRDRYRLAVPFIDTFTKRQFASSRVAEARDKTISGLHPFWIAQIVAGRRVRSGSILGGALNDI